MSDNASSPVISVVMPAYNADKYINEAIDSVLNQTFDDFELIIVNDGSKDNTETKIKEYDDSRIKYIYQENSGSAVARNTGIKQSRGKYIAFIDADDIWMPYKLMKQLNVFSQDQDLGLVYGWVQSIYPDGSPKCITKPDKEGWVYKDLLLNNFQHNGSMQMIRRECLDDVGFFDENSPHCQDYDLWVRLAKKYRFGLTRDILVKYRVLPNSLSKHHKNLVKYHFRVIERELKTSDIGIKKLRGKIYSEYYYYLFNTCYFVIRNKKFAQKYLFLSFIYDPIAILKRFNFKSFTSYLKFVLQTTISNVKSA